MIRSSALLFFCALCASAQPPPQGPGDAGQSEKPRIQKWLMTGLNFDVAKAVQPPRFLNIALNDFPAFPEGTSIEVSLDIDRHGQPQNVKARVHPASNPSAVEAELRKWTFAPAQKEGQPADAKCRFVLSYGAIPVDRNPVAAILGALPSRAPSANGTASGPNIGVAPEPGSLLRKVMPDYPAAARQARVQGTVTFSATIAEDGSIKQLTLISGHPLLVQAAYDAVRQWQYKPPPLDGQPVEVVTTVQVNFALPH